MSAYLEALARSRSGALAEAQPRRRSRFEPTSGEQDGTALSWGEDSREEDAPQPTPGVEAPRDLPSPAVAPPAKAPEPVAQGAETPAPQPAATPIMSRAPEPDMAPLAQTTTRAEPQRVDRVSVDLSEESEGPPDVQERQSEPTKRQAPLPADAGKEADFAADLPIAPALDRWAAPPSLQPVSPAPVVAAEPERAAVDAFPVPVPSEPLEATVLTGPDLPPLVIEIGQIDIRILPPAATEPRARATPRPAPVVSLGDFLSGRAPR